MNILLLKGYNNYFNRIVKKEDSTANYRTAVLAVGGNFQDIASVDFNPNDGIVTELIVGKGTSYFTNWEIGSPDYLVTYEIVNSVETIKHRWFILEAKRTRGGQYRLTLKRDILADFYDDFKNAPCYIEKATIDDKANMLLYNSEGLAVNQIKTSENLIKDATGVPWIVGYVSSKLSTSTTTGQVATVSLSNSGTASGSFVYTASTSFVRIYIQYNGENIYGNDGTNRFTYTFNVSTGVLTYSINVSSWESKTCTMYTVYTASPSVFSENYSTSIPGDESRRHLVDAPYDMFCIPFGAVHLRTANVDTDKDAAIEIAFEFAKDLGKESIYDLQLLPYCPRRDVIVGGEIAEVLMTNNVDYNYITSGGTTKSIIIWCDKSTGSFTAEPENAIEVERPKSTNTTISTVSSTNARVITSSNYSKVSFTDASIAGLPDVTVTGVTVSKGSYNAASSGINSFSYNKETGYIMGEIYTPDFQTGTTTGWTATITYTHKTYTNPEYMDYKISNECDIYRLTSPNYNGQFEWSLAKAGGSANYFDVDFTYKPFQPYIHVAPTFRWLYGQDFDDARGLVCGGDFSLPIITDAWTEFQVYNKNYQNIFDREIQNFDVNRVANSEVAAIQGGLGIFTGTLGGAAAGFKAGGSVGAGIGAAAGLGAGTAGFIADINYQNKVYDEQRSFMTDMFNYKLQNVQALPYNLLKVAAYTANNKVFPMVEYFTCTDVEKEALKNKMTYNGMTVMVIGKISDYVKSGEQRFIKGQLIRLPAIKENSQVADEIYKEISKGVYI